MRFNRAKKCFDTFCVLKSTVIFLQKKIDDKPKEEKQIIIYKMTTCKKINCEKFYTYFFSYTVSNATLKL